MQDVLMKTGVNRAVGSLGRVVVFRLPPGADLLKGIEEEARLAGIYSGVILSGAASLRKAVLRNVKNFPEKFPITDSNRSYTSVEGPLEVLALAGNISSMPDGSVWVHAHVTVSTSAPGAQEGAAFGGHLVPGAIVFSTAEIVVAEIAGMTMRRLQDAETRAMELVPEALS